MRENPNEWIALVAQVSKPAVSPISKSAGCWKAWSVGGFRNPRYSRLGSLRYELTGKRKGQVSWTEIIKPYLTRLEFDEKGMANKFVVFEKNFEGGIRKRVTMQPNVNFGEPTVEGTGYRASTLRDALLAEGSRESVVRFYEVDEHDVIVAVEAFQYAPELKAAA